MHPKRPHTIAFTLTELMIVIVLVGMIASFAIPNYTKAIHRAKEKDAVANLELIREAVRLYMSREGGATPPDLANVGAVNTTLYLNILEQGNTYDCINANIYTCSAKNAAWKIQFQLNLNDGAIFCKTGPCPTL